MTRKSYPKTADRHQVLLYDVDTLWAIPREVPGGNDHFILLIAADTTHEDGGRLVSAAEAIIRQGASYVCCWGPDCSRLHDCFDEADLEVNGEATDYRVLMTTWHENEPLEEAMWFALNSAFPSTAYESRTRAVVIATVSNHDWYTIADRYLQAGAPIPDEA